LKAEQCLSVAVDFVVAGVAGVAVVVFGMLLLQQQLHWTVLQS